MTYTVSAGTIGQEKFSVHLPDRNTEVTGVIDLIRLLGADGISFGSYDKFEAELLKTGKASETVNSGKLWIEPPNRP